MRAIRRPTAALLAAALVLGCASARERGHRPSSDGAGGVSVAVFADDDAREAGALHAGSVAGVLERREGDAWRPLFHSLESSWTVAGLAPGDYRLRFDLVLDDSGHPEPLDRPVVEKFRVEEGEIVEVELVIDHVSPALVAAGVAAVVVAAVLLHEWLADVDLPAPPLPPAWAVETAYWVTIEAASHPPTWMPRDRAPQVTSHFPRADSVLPAGRVRVVFSLSEPVDPERLADVVAVETTAGEPVPGEVAWDAGRWWIVWEPSEELPADETYRVTLRGEDVVDAVGAPLRRPSSFEFSTAP